MYPLIAVDEYQDSNRVQEDSPHRARRQPVSWATSQSIYRFQERTAPRKTPALLSGEMGTRIDLAENPLNEVLQSVNEVFEVVMQQRSGDIDYDERARLSAARTAGRARGAAPSA